MGPEEVTGEEQRAFFKGVARGHEDFDTSKVTRVEVITLNGRGYTNYDASHVSISLQDTGRTLKVFIDG